MRSPRLTPVLTNQTLRRMTRIELVQYGLQGDRERRRAADEMFRRFHEKFRGKGLLEADDDGQPAASMPRARTGDLL